MEKYPFIVLEGPSGVGKSTVARLLAEMIGGKYLTTPPEPFRSIRHVTDQECSHEVRYHFYLAGVLHASAMIRKLVQLQPVICDRFILTTECFHRVIGVRTRVNLTELDLINPDLTVLLTAEKGVLKTRLDHRGRTLLDILESETVSCALLEAYREWCLREINTSCLTPQQVANEILELLAVTRKGAFDDRLER